MPQTLYEEDNAAAELKKVGKPRLAEAAERQRGSEQLAGTDTAVSDLSPTPTGKQTGSLFDLWSASLTGWPLLRLKEAGESAVVIGETCPYCSFSQVRRTLSCALCQFGISKQFSDAAEPNAAASDAL